MVTPPAATSPASSAPISARPDRTTWPCSTIAATVRYRPRPGRSTNSPTTARTRGWSAVETDQPLGKDEGLVCFDSRLPGGFDLADKELAVLIAELAANDPHIAIILDCCHSGSGTRDADAFSGLTIRATTDVFPERPLESYIDGHYARLQRQGESLFIPNSRHILLAACDSKQTAKETRDRSGVFTSTLVDVLSKSVSDLSYSDLFVRCRAAVRTRADNQDPQFEPIGDFNAFGGFLGGK